MSQQILPTGPQAGPSPPGDGWTWIITVIAVIVAAAVTFGGLAVKERLSESDEPPMDPLLAFMTLCVKQTLEELGPPPPTGDQLMATGRDATTAFEGSLTFLRYWGEYDRSNHQCATDTAKVRCDLPNDPATAYSAGCWRASDPSTKVEWEQVSWADMPLDDAN